MICRHDLVEAAVKTVATNLHEPSLQILYGVVIACDSVLPYERVACVFIYVLSECPEMWMCVSMCRHVRWMLYVLYSLATLAT